MNYKNSKQILCVSLAAAFLFLGCLGMELEGELERAVSNYCDAGEDVWDRNFEKTKSIKGLVVGGLVNWIVEEGLKEELRGLAQDSHLSGGQGVKRKREGEDFSEEDASSSDQEDSDCSESEEGSSSEEDEGRSGKRACLSIAEDNNSKYETNDLEILPDKKENGHDSYPLLEVQKFQNDLSIEKMISGKAQKERKSLLSSALSFVREMFIRNEDGYHSFQVGPFNSSVSLIVKLYNASDNKKVVVKKIQKVLDPQKEPNLFQNLACCGIGVARCRWAFETLHDSFKIDLNVEDGKGNTPTHVALINGNVGIATLFINMGAEILLKNREGDDVLGCFLKNAFIEKRKTKQDGKKWLGSLARREKYAEFLSAIFKQASNVTPKQREEYINIIERYAKKVRCEVADKDYLITQISNWKSQKEN